MSDSNAQDDDSWGSENDEVLDDKEHEAPTKEKGESCQERESNEIPYPIQTRISLDFAKMRMNKCEGHELPVHPSARWKWAVKNIVSSIRSAYAFLPKEASDMRLYELKEYLRSPRMRIELDRALFVQEIDEDFQHRQPIHFDSNNIESTEIPSPPSHLFAICRQILRQPRRRRTNAELTVLLEMLELNPYILQSLDIPLRMQLARRMRIKRYKSGEVIFRPGEEECALRFVFSGKIEMQVDIGLRLVLGVYGPGDIFGDNILHSTAPRRMTAVCRGDCNIAIVRRFDIEKARKALIRQDELEKACFLKKLPHFSVLFDKDLLCLGKLFKRRNFKDTEVICEQGELCTSLFYLIGGECRVIKTLMRSDGPYFLEVHHYTTYQIFGSCDLTFESATSAANLGQNTVSVIAQGVCEVIEVPVQSLQHILNHSPGQYSSCFWHMCEYLTEVNKWFSARVVELILEKRRDWTNYKEKTLKSEIASYKKQFETKSGTVDFSIPVISSPPKSPSSPTSPKTLRSTPSPRLSNVSQKLQPNK